MHDNTLLPEDAGPKAERTPLSLVQALIIGACIIGVCLLGTGLIIRSALAPQTSEADTKAAVADIPVDIAKVKVEGQPYIGNLLAKVTIAYWSDFQCPYCKEFEKTGLQSIIQEYVESGKVRVVFKDYSFLGADSLTAALYGRAMWELYPDTYFTWRETMFATQDAENGGFGNETSVLALTATMPGVDAEKVKKQVADKRAEYQKAIEADRIEAVSMGITGTPSSITGTERLRGLTPFKTFQKSIDKQLSAK